MKLENIMLSEINQAQKDKYSMISCIWSTQNKQTHKRHKIE